MPTFSPELIALYKIGFFQSFFVFISKEVCYKQPGYEQLDLGT